MENQMMEKHHFKHPFYILLIILIIATILANVIPSGLYDRILQDGRSVVDANSFKYIEKQYVGITDFFLSFYYGMESVAGLMALIFFAGGAFGIIKKIGLMEASIKYLAKKLKNTKFYIVSFVLMAIIGTQVAFTSMWELSIVIIPMVVPLILALGYDVLTGAAIVMLSTCAGFGAALTNPLFTAIAHKIAGLPIYSGLWFRAICFVVILLICYIYLLIYANKIKKDPSKSLMADVKTDFVALDEAQLQFTTSLQRAGITFLVIFGILLWGVIFKGFDFPEISSCFVAIGFGVGLAYGSSINEICEMFSDGMKELFIPAMIMIFAAAILHILNEAAAIDTIISYLSNLVVGHSPIITGNLMLIMQSAINFIIPSGSGQALITMPIMVPLADMGGITRQVAALASQFGDGFSNFIYPTNGTLIAILMAGGIPYLKWFKFFFPLFLIIMLTSSFLVSIAVLIQLGPF